MSFQVLLRLGAGGMGEVHLALMTTPQGQEVVALKRLHRELLGEPSVVSRFEREAKICSLLSHPLIVGLHRHGCDEAGPWLALEYVHGRSASALIKEWTRRAGALPLKAALSICHDAAEALDCAHSLRGPGGEPFPVIHRDISPDNVLVAYTGEAKLTDFGIARVADGGARLTRTGFVPGKAGFMSPEVLSGEPGTTASDIFALAATLYRVLTGVRAFQGNTEVEVLKAVINAQPPSVSALRPEVPAALAEWIDAGLSKRPLDRPHDLAAFCALISGPTGQARAATAECMNTAFPAESDPHRSELKVVIERTRSLRPTSTVSTGRNPRRSAWGLVAATAVLLTVGSLGGLAYWRRAPPQPVAVKVELRPVKVDPKPPLEVPPPLDAGPPLAPRPVPATRPAPKRKPGKLLVRSEPSVVVFVDGEYRGPAPIKLELPAGEHTVLFSHPVLQRAHSVKVEVRPGDTRLVSHRFSPADAGRGP